jgi:hypothetical protein
MKTASFLSLVSGLSFLATSCATFPGNGVPKVAATPASNVKKVPLSYLVTAAATAPADGQSLPVPQFSPALESAIKDSGRFSSVTQGRGRGVHLDVNMRNYGNGPAAFASGFISGFSLFTIPGFGKDNYKLTATARSATGKTRNYVLEDSATTVIWLPLIVATPFSNPTIVVPEVQANLYRNLIQNMENDGIIPKAAN